MSAVTYLQNFHTGGTTFKVGDEVENDSIRFFIGLINDSGNLCFVDKEKPWNVKDQTNPMAKCMLQGNFGITSHLLKRITPPAAQSAPMQQEQSAPRGGELVNLAKFEGNVLLNIDGSLYTRPQQLVWFSLTDEEIQAIAFESADKESAVYKAEAKLKAKNFAKEKNI